MKPSRPPQISKPPRREHPTRQRNRGTHAATDLLILSDGTVLAHNLTPELGALLKRLNELPD